MDNKNDPRTTRTALGLRKPVTGYGCRYDAGVLWFGGAKVSRMLGGAELLSIHFLAMPKRSNVLMASKRGRIGRLRYLEPTLELRCLAPCYSITTVLYLSYFVPYLRYYAIHPFLVTYSLYVDLS